MATTTKDKLLDTAELCTKTALEKGAQEAGARTYRVRDIEVRWRDGKLEKIQEATTRGVGLQLYVDGRYASVSSSDLRPDALETFIADSVAMTRALTKDPFRSLPDPALYKGQAAVDLKLDDPKYSTVTPDVRLEAVKGMEASARGVKGAEAILSVTTTFNDTLSESFRVHSNGFSGSRRDTAFWVSAEVNVKDPDGRKPEDYSYAGARFLGELPATAEQGRIAATRALS